MEESKELQGMYTFFRSMIYVWLLGEFFMYALDPTALDFLGGLVVDIHPAILQGCQSHAGNHYLHRNKEQEAAGV